MRRSFVAALTLVAALGINMGTVQAASTVPWLTGTFDFTNGPGSNFGEGGNTAFFAFLPPNAEIFFAPPANLPYNTIITCLDPDCQGYLTETIWNGSASGGMAGFLNVRFDPSDTPINMAGWMTGGVISGDRLTCFVLGFCDTLIANEWQFDYAFRGVWSNGWWSEGTVEAHVATTGDTFGSVEMTTHTPESTTVALLGAGLIPISRTMRRRFRR